MGTLFDVRNVKAEQRYDYWHDLVCRYFCRAEIGLMTEKFNAASMSWNQLGCLSLGDIHCEALHYERSLADIKADPCEDFLVSLMLKGEAHMTQAGRETMQKPGDVVFYDSAQGFTYEFLQPYRMIILRIPRRSLLSRLPAIEHMTSVAMSSQSDMGNLVRSMLLNAMSVQMPSTHTASARLGASIIDVLAAAMESEVMGQTMIGDRQKRLLQRAKDYMIANLDDPDLSVESVARAVAVSTRTLNRLFAAGGTPVMRWLLQQRLQEGHHILTEGRASQVTEVALSLGFTSVSHFSRTFKDAYGVSPRTMLQH